MGCCYRENLDRARPDFLCSVLYGWLLYEDETRSAIGVPSRRLRDSAVIGTIWNVVMSWGAVWIGLVGRAGDCRSPRCSRRPRAVILHFDLESLSAR